MEIQLKISVHDNTVQPNKVALVYSLSSEMNDFFYRKDYGDDVKKIEIGFLIVLDRPGYENWYKVKKPKYTEYKKTKDKLIGEDVIIEKTFSYEIRFSEEQLYKFTGGDDQLSKEVLISEILKSLSNLDKLPKTIVSFDKEKFKEDLELFLNTKR